MASNKRYDDLAAKKSLETKIFKTTTASLRKELKKVKSEKSAVILAAEQAANKAQADTLASNKRYDGLAAKSSKEINNLKINTTTLEKILEKVKSEKSAVILTAEQAANKAQADTLASNKRYDGLAAKSSKEINTLKTNTTTLEKVLEKVKSEKSAVILAAEQAANKAQADTLASNKRYDDLAAKSSKEINTLKTNTTTLEKELEKVKSEKSAVILTAEQAANKAQADTLASNKRYDGLAAKSSKEINTLKTNTTTLEKVLEKVKSEKSAVILTAEQAANKAQADTLASNKRYDDLAAKSSKEINTLKTKYHYPRESTREG